MRRDQLRRQSAADIVRHDTRGARTGAGGIKQFSPKHQLVNNLHVKELFLDRDAVLKLIGRRQAFVFAKFGHAVMRQDRESQPFRVAPSKPGSPPHAHRPHPYVRKFTFFSYEPNKNSVVIGPVRLPKKGKGRSLATVPETLEYGRGGQVENPRWRTTAIGKTGIVEVGKGERKLRNYRGKLVRVTFATIRSSRQLARAVSLQREVIGGERFNVRARPHTLPAFHTILPTLPTLWTAAWNHQK